MSLDDTGLSVWQLERPPLGMLVAAKATEMLGARLSDEVKAPFQSLSSELLDWWPKRKTDPEQICENQFRTCLEQFGEKPPAKVQPLLKGATLQMAGLLRVAPMSLPAGQYYELDESDFQVLLRDAAKAGKLPVVQLEARLKHLLEFSRDPWHKILTRVDRMSWGRSEPWSKLDKRLRSIASLADLGATPTWIDVGKQRALSIELEGTKRIAPLSPEELASLKKVIPTIPEP